MRRFLMRIVSRKAIREAAARHGEWSASLNAWYKIANRCRLIATIKYTWRMVYIRRILSHADYDEKEWQK